MHNLKGDLKQKWNNAGSILLFWNKTVKIDCGFLAVLEIISKQVAAEVMNRIQISMVSLVFFSGTPLYDINIKIFLEHLRKIFANLFYFKRIYL